jgi:hypothetical protein
MVNIKISSRYMMAVLIVLSLHSCKDALEDSLDVVPRDQLTDVSVWTDQNTADLFLNDIYNRLPDGNNWYDPLENWSDNAQASGSWPVSKTTTVRHGEYTPSTIAFWCGYNDQLPYNWSHQYQWIRKTNVFIKNVTASDLPEDYKKKRLAEARFLRAYFHHNLWIGYGAIPIISEPLNRAEHGEEIFKARNTSNEVFTFITDELAAIAEDLPAVVTGQDYGRITKGAALTLKGWCELFASKYSEAAATNKAVIDLGVYALHPDYQAFFLPEGNSSNEGILFRQYIPGVKGGRESSLLGPTFTKGGVETSWGYSDPTQELVDDYAMDNGLPITDPASGYNPEDPYINREKRFYQSIVYDGSYWYNDIIYTRVGVGSLNEIDVNERGDASNTGYYFRKRMNDQITLGAANWDGATSGQNYYLFRYAEVLLNYAEAKIELDQIDQTVYEAINSIRQRSELPTIEDAYGSGLSREKMREIVRRERRIELALEDKRWWDLMRWRTAEMLLNGPLHGIRITVDANGKLTYIPVPAYNGSRKFDPSKNYLFPIPQSAIDQNPKLEQNPGYQ